MTWNSTLAKLQSSVTPGRAMRFCADALFIALALAVAMVVRLLFLLAFQKPEGDTAVYYVQWYGLNFLRAFGPLLIISSITFWLHGFYSYGKSYRSKYKLLVVVRAVFIAFIAFGFVEYFATEGEFPMARTVWPLAWLFATLFLVGARIWSDTWQRVAVPEAKRREQENSNSVLVIGGAGYIGSALLPLLLEQGYKVRLLDILMFGREPIRQVLDHPNLEVIEGNFQDVVTAYQAMQGVDSVIHLGAIVGDPACNLNEELTIDVNLISTRVLAELAKSAGVRRFIFASSCSVYGASDDLLDESSPVQPISLYGHTKSASEQVLLSLADENFSPILLRFATIFGLSGRTRFDLVVNLLAAKAKIDSEITVFGGNQWRPFVHVQDAARSVAAVLKAPLNTVANQVYNVGSNDQNYTILQIGELIREQVVGAELIHTADDTDNRNYRVCFDKIHSDTEFQAEWTVEQGVQQVLEAIAAGEIHNYTDSRFSNAKFLTESGPELLGRERWARELIDDLSKTPESH
jgi:nucleoside-diphosphate-sugar epimerase